MSGTCGWASKRAEDVWQRQPCGAAPKRARSANRYDHIGKDVITMAATAAVVPAIPDRAAFMATVSDRFRALARRTLELVKTTKTKAVQVAKKTGNWALGFTPVNWAWNKVSFAGRKVWKWTRDAGPYLLLRDALNFAGAGFGAAVGFTLAGKLVALMSALGVVAAIAVVVHVVRKRRKERVILVTAEETSEAPQEPKKPRRRVVTKKVTETVTETDEGTTEEVTAEEVETAVDEINEVIAAANQTSDEEAAVPANGNGYKIRLPEGDLIPTETLAKRFSDLDVLINVQLNQLTPDQEYICELQGRQNLIHVRAGKHSKVKYDATVRVIHKDFRDSLEAAWRIEHDRDLGTPADTGIYPTALYRGAMAENSRLNKVIQLKATHDRLKSGSKKVA